MPIRPGDYQDVGRYSLSRLVELGDFDLLVNLLTQRKNCRENASYEECGMDPDEITKHTNRYGMDLLYQMAIRKSGGDNSPEMNEKQITIVSLLMNEGLDYLYQYQGYGDNALTMALKRKKKDMFLFFLEDARIKEESSIILEWTLFNWHEKLHFLAAKYMPNDEDLHQILEEYGFDYDDKSRTQQSVREVRESIIRKQNREL